jgi:hypothetical protein
MPLLNVGIQQAGNAENARCPCAKYHAMIQELVGLKDA